MREVFGKWPGLYFFLALKVKSMVSGFPFSRSLYSGVYEDTRSIDSRYGNDRRPGVGFNVGLGVDLPSQVTRSGKKRGFGGIDRHCQWVKFIKITQYVVQSLKASDPEDPKASHKIDSVRWAHPRRSLSNYSSVVN